MENKYAPQIATLLSSILWGSSFVAIGWGLKYLDPYSFAFIRFFAATAILVSAALLYKFDWRIFSKRSIIGIGAINGIAYLLQFVGQEYTTPAKTALLVNLNVIVVALLSSRFFGEKLDRSKIYAVIAGAMGVFLITTKGDIRTLLGAGRTEFLGDMLALLAGIAWAFYIIMTKKAVSTAAMGEKEGKDVMQITTAVFAYTSLAMLPIFLISGGIGKIPQIPLNGWIAIIYTAIFCTVAAFLLWSYGLRKISATSSSVMLLMEVVSAFLLSIALGLEGRFTAAEIAGIAFIAAAFLLATLEFGGGHKPD